MMANGYGVVNISIGRRQTKKVLAHRFAWEQTTGTPLGSDVVLCHHCDNPPCVRPDHLFAGTQRDNIHDMIRKGRGNLGYRGDWTRCVRGHEFTCVNTRIAKDGRRRCRECFRAYDRERKRLARAAAKEAA